MIKLDLRETAVQCRCDIVPKSVLFFGFVLMCTKKDVIANVRVLVYPLDFTGLRRSGFLFRFADHTNATGN